jgi:hypothetical protein
VLRVCNTAGIKIVLIASQAGYNVDGLAKMLSGPVSDLHQQGLDLMGVPIAVRRMVLAAFAGELAFLEILDSLPEDILRGIRGIGIFKHIVSYRMTERFFSFQIDFTVCGNTAEVVLKILKGCGSFCAQKIVRISGIKSQIT